MSQGKTRLLVGIFFALLATFLIAINLIPAIFIRVPFNPVGNQRFDVIIALGYPALEDGHPSPMLKQRVIAAIKLFKDHHADYIIFTGGAAHNRFVEAEVMVELARSLGVPTANIIQEGKAENTCQNAFNSVKIMQEKNWHSAVVVTSPNHLKRASYLFAHYPIHLAVSSSDYPAEMNLFERVLFKQWEQYSLTRLTFSGYPSCKS
jgi:uncharacterized SAM-binding protein YcdF (DUF218 family)